MCTILPSVFPLTTTPTYHALCLIYLNSGECVTFWWTPTQAVPSFWGWFWEVTCLYSGDAPSSQITPIVVPVVDSVSHPRHAHYLGGEIILITHLYLESGLLFDMKQTEHPAVLLLG